LVATGLLAADIEKKTIQVGGFEREYLMYVPKQVQQKNADGIIVCLHGFGRTMNDFFVEYDITDIADSLNMIIAAPQALPEQNQQVILDAVIVNSFIGNSISLHSVWGCGLSVSVTSLGFNLFYAELNKDVDDVEFIDQMIDSILADYALSDDNLFMLGTSMGGFMTYQYALRKGERLAGMISIAGSMGLAIQGMDNATRLPVCDFHSTTDEVVFYNGTQTQLLAVVSLARPKTEVLNYWAVTNATGAPVTEQVQYYPPANDITVEKIIYPEKDNEVIHYKINGAPHNYFFKKEAGDCMDHVEEITRFIQSHFSGPISQIQPVTSQKPTFYPNPVQDRIYMDTDRGIVTLFDITGRHILTQSFTEGIIDLSFLKPGIYIIRIQSGNAIISNTLIKK
jgi:poly(3-hydroxybutyrate) depolymerase